MGEGFYVVDIVIFALIAGFLVFRLRSVLGRRHGEERPRPNPFAGVPEASSADSNVVVLPDRSQPAAAEPTSEEPHSLADGLQRIRAVDAAFDEKSFLQGARAAFTTIVQAFAKGDLEALRPLLSDDVYDSFAEAIGRRTAAGEIHETRLDRIKDADLLEARLDGRTAYVTAKFVSEQLNVTRDAGGAVVDGDAERFHDVTDIWTFARNTRSRDPNWLLIETRTPN
ncbi:MAG: Tim44/TimA family putative adaptor protein [Azospirillum sp.]|nr:Tim44/TimA family putative adaptor protein [Azospirillum sp.]